MLKSIKTRQEGESEPAFLEKIRERLIQGRLEQPFSRMAQEEYMEILKKLIDKFSPKHKQALTEYYLEGKTLDEIAKHMGNTKQDVYELLRYARSALEKNLQKYNF